MVSRARVMFVRRRASAQVGLHRHAAVVAADAGEAVALVQPDRWAVGLDAEADRGVPVRTRSRDQRVQQLGAEPRAAPAWDNRDRQLRRLLVDKAVAVVVVREQPVPGGADTLEVLDRYQR